MRLEPARRSAEWVGVGGVGGVWGGWGGWGVEGVEGGRVRGLKSFGVVSNLKRGDLHGVGGVDGGWERRFGEFAMHYSHMTTCHMFSAFLCPGVT